MEPTNNCPNYDLLDFLLAAIDLKVQFGNPVGAITRFCDIAKSGSETVYDNVINLLSDRSLTVDCQFVKILFRIVIELRNRYETFDDYCYWRNIPIILEPTWATFLDDHPREQYDYLVIDELPGILMEDIGPLLDNAYAETYWYSPKATAYLMKFAHLSDDEIEEWPGIHAIYRKNEWIYIDRNGTVKITNIDDIIKDIEIYCTEVLGIEAGLIVMNPEDTRVCFNE